MELYHVLNRGVDKRAIVNDDSDRLRFIHDLYAFNDIRQSANFIQRNQPDDPKRKREVLVHIHAFCLMGNHYHLLLSEAVENGIPLFMKKLNMGYSKYFNARYERTGALWQGKYKKILISQEAHFNYIPYYIHLNPLDFTMPEWREGEVHNKKEMLEYLKTYRWSSHLDYLGIRNFPSIIYRDLLKHTLGPKSKYEKELLSIARDSILAQESNYIE